MITKINEYKLYLEHLRVPQFVELDDSINYKEIDYNDIHLIDLGGDDINTAHLGVQLPHENKPNKGIVLDIRIIQDLYLINLLIDHNLQNKGIGYKIYKKFISEFGHVYSSYDKRVNREEVDSIWKKLQNEKLFDVHTTKHGQICILRSNPDKIEILNNFNALS